MYPEGRSLNRSSQSVGQSISQSISYRVSQSVLSPAFYMTKDIKFGGVGNCSKNEWKDFTFSQSI